MLIAERDSGVTTGRYQLAYAERSFGKEEEVISTELVAAVRFGANGTASLVIARDSDAGLAYALVERTGPRQWATRWTSALAKWLLMRRLIPRDYRRVPSAWPSEAGARARPTAPASAARVRRYGMARKT